ncbi:glycoside hydrolase family 1 protein [Candidatus Daviesbacteria bacterium]|nr:glycoside hydrolase family 1 protein [Candidatus Daviesbacteria bacterium]
MDLKDDKPRHEHNTLNFPEGFLWGAATSAFQTEGNARDSDWWHWEQIFQPPEKRSGRAADFYHHYPQDFKIARKLSHSAHRLSLEWSRIEPRNGEFNQAQIEHYQKMLKSLREKNMQVMLTLHHFSNPEWFAKLGGWTNSKSSFYFERFIKKIVPEIAPLVDFWVTINEPGIYAHSSFVAKQFPPQKKNWWLFIKALWNMSLAHKKAYKFIHSILPQAQVGIANGVVSFDIFHRHSILESLTQILADFFTNHLFYFFAPKKYHDFLGLNYYTNQYISFNGESRLPNLVDITKTKKEVSDLGWEIFPEGIFDIIMDFSDYHLPIYITENGIASTNDDRRVRFLLSYLHEIYHAIQTGAPVKGYFYWSLLDNMELYRGFGPKFGLIEVDFKTQKRTIRPSAYVYKEIIKENGIPHKLLKLLGHGIAVSDVLNELRQQ